MDADHPNDPGPGMPHPALYRMGRAGRRAGPPLPPPRRSGRLLLTALVAGVTLASCATTVYLLSLPQDDALLSAVPIPDPRESAERKPLVLEGDPPNPADPPPGCRFHTRCPWQTPICAEVEPPIAEYDDGHGAACHHPRNVDAKAVKAATFSDRSPETAGDVLPKDAEAAEAELLAESETSEEPAPA